MKIKFTFKTILYVLLISNSYSQTSDLNIKDSDYYLGIIDDNMVKKLVKKNVLSDSLWITSKYIDRETKGFNKKGSKIFKKIQIKEHLAYFKDYMFLQNIKLNDYVYALFFTMEGINNGISNGTLTWKIVRFEKEEWKPIKRLKKNKLRKNNNSFKVILSSQDIVPSLFSDPNERILIEKKHLILEREKMFHSLYNLQTEEIIINEVKPWLHTDKDDKKSRIEWIRTNLHEKIVDYLEKTSE